VLAVAAEPERRATKAERREALVRGAIDLIAEKGLDGTRVADIGERSGISPGQVLYYFDGKSDIFWRIILPGTLPSIVVGSAVGMGITWEVVVAAEMISGGGSQIGGTSGGGLGFFIWNSYVGGSYEQIVVGMISIGIAGFISSELIRALGRRVTPWLRLR